MRPVSLRNSMPIPFLSEQGEQVHPRLPCEARVEQSRRQRTASDESTRKVRLLSTEGSSATTKPSSSRIQPYFEDLTLKYLESSVFSDPFFLSFAASPNIAGPLWLRLPTRLLVERGLHREQTRATKKSGKSQTNRCKTRPKPRHRLFPLSLSN